MNLRRLYRFVLLAAAGGMVFQTATSCSQIMDTFATAAIPTLTSTLTSLITDTLQGGTTTSDSVTSTCPEGGSIFSAVCTDIQNVNSSFQQTTPSQSGTSSQSGTDTSGTSSSGS